MKLVLTGGPSGGKTTMGLAMTKMFNGQVVMVPEAASILFSGGFHRCRDTAGVRHQQKAIYHVQVEHEAIFQLQTKDQLIICDRGTLDGAAYWPDPAVSFFETIATSKDQELQRYDWVIHLDTAHESSYNMNNNHLRVEQFEEADRINDRVKEAWEGHPQRFIIPSTESFATKVSQCLAIVEKVLIGKSYSDICKEVLGC